MWVSFHDYLTMEASATRPATVVATNPFYRPDGSSTVETTSSGPTRMIKGGQTIGEGFSQSIIAAYSNAAQNPLIFALYVVAIACMVASLTGVDSPLEVVQKEANATATARGTNVAVKSICVALVRLLGILNKYEYIFINTTMLTVPYFLKPSNKNLYISIFFTGLVIAFSSISYVVIFLLTQVWFLFTQLRNPTYKLTISAVVVLLMIFSFTEVQDSALEVATPTPPTGRAVTEAEQMTQRMVAPPPRPVPGDETSFPPNFPLSMDRLALLFETAAKNIIVTTAISPPGASIYIYNGNKQSPAVTHYLVPLDAFDKFAASGKPGLVTYRKPGTFTAENIKGLGFIL